MIPVLLEKWLEGGESMTFVPNNVSPDTLDISAAELLMEFMHKAKSRIKRVLIYVLRICGATNRSSYNARHGLCGLIQSCWSASFALLLGAVSDLN